MNKNILVLVFSSLLSMNVMANDVQVNLERGIQSYEVKQYDQAKSFLQKVILEDPKNAQAYYWLGQTHEQQKNTSEALRSYQTSYQLDSKSGQTNAAYGLLLYAQGQTKKAKQLLDQALKYDAASSMVHTRLGQYYQQDKDYKKALYHFDQASGMNPQNERARVGVVTSRIAMGEKPNDMMFELESLSVDFPKNTTGLILIGDGHMARNDLNAAVKSYSTALKKNPKDGMAWLKIGKALSQSQRYEQASKSFDRAILYGAPKEDVYYEKGRAEFGQGNMKEALGLFQKCTKEDSDYAGCWLYQGKIFHKTKEYNKAVSALNQGISSSKGRSAEMYAVLGDVYFAQDRFDQAKGSYQKAISQDKNSAHGQYGLGRVYEATGNTRQALNAYARAASNDKQVYALKSKERRGFIFLREQKYKDAFSIFQEVTSLNPNDAVLWNAFGESALGVRDYTTALDSFNRSIAFQVKNYHKPYENKAHTYKTMKQWREAKQAYEVAVTREPMRVDLWTDLLEVSRELDDYKSQVYALKALENIEKENVTHSYQLGVLYQSKNSLIQAKQAYEKAYGRDAKHLPTLVALGDMAYQAKAYGESERYYKEALAINENNLKVIDRLAMISFISKDYRKAASYYDKHLEIEPNSPTQAYMYAVTQDRLKESPETLIPYYQRAFSLDKKNAKAGIRLAQLKNQTDDKKGAVATYQEVISNSPEAHEALEQKAMLLLSMREYKEAAEHFEMLHKRRAPSALSARGLGRSYRLMGENQKAEQNYELALSLLEEPDPEIQYELALVQESLGKKQDARDTLTKIIIKNPNDLLAQEKLGDLYIENKEPKKAIASYQVVAKQKPKDAKVHEKLGLAYQQVGQNPQAITSLKKAISLDNQRHASYFAMASLEPSKSLWYLEKSTQIQPKKLDYQLSYAQELARQKKHPESLAVFKKAERLAPRDLVVLMGLAKAYDANRKFKESTEIYTKVVVIDAKHKEGWVGLGNAYHQLQSYTNSAKAYERAHQLDPKDVEVAYFRGRAYHLDKQWDNAIKSYQTTLALDAKHFGSLYALGTIYYGQKKFDESKKYLIRAVAVSPRHSPSQQKLGEIYFQEQSYQDSFQAYRVVKDVSPNMPIAYLRLGMIQNRWNKLEPAEDHLKQAIKLDPKNEVGHFELGMVYKKMKKENLALTSFERTTQIKSDHAQAWYEKALIFDVKSQKKRKVRSFEKAIESDNQYTEARLAFAQMYEGTQEYLNAIDQYRAILGYAPDSRDVVLTLGELDLYVDKPDFAVRDTAVFAKNHPKDVQIQMLRGRALYANKDIREAKKVLSEVVLLDRNQSEAHAFLGLIHKEEGKLSRATKSFERAIDINSKSAMAYHGLGQVFVEEEKYQEAINMQNKALSIDPGLRDAYFYMGVAYKALGKEAEADEAFSKSVPVDGIDGLSNPKDLDKAYKNFRK